MRLPGQNYPESSEPEFGGVPGQNMWMQRMVAGSQDNYSTTGKGLSPYSYPFFVPPYVPGQNPNTIWSGLPDLGSFIPWSAFQPGMAFFPMYFGGISHGFGGNGVGGSASLSLTYTSNGQVITVDEVELIDFTNWQEGLVSETSPGNVVIYPPSGTGSTGNLTVVGGSSTNGTNGPLFIPTGSGNSFSGNITVALNYDTVLSFAPGISLQLQDIPANVLNATTVPPTTVVTTVTTDTKGRVSAQTTRDVGLFKITKASRLGGNLWWTYEMNRVRDSEVDGDPILVFPFTESTSGPVTSYNGLEATNPSSGTCFGLAVSPTGASVANTPISLDGTYEGFVYDHVPLGTIVLAFKEGSVNPKWWFNAPNPVTGECP
jgi:hypothetical protein